MKTKLSIIMVILGVLHSGNTYAQYASKWDEVIKEIKGDTAVVKGWESTHLINTLLVAILADTNDKGERNSLKRIYETIPGETYIADRPTKLDISIPKLHITAPLPPPGVKPPLLIKTYNQIGQAVKTFFETPGDSYMENQYVVHAYLQETIDREFMRCHGTGSHHEFKNMIFELTNWTQVLPQKAKRITFKYSDCKFLNVGNEANLEKGCVMETRESPPDTVWMENCTFLNGGSFILGLYNNGPLYIYLNHNTVVNCLQPPVSEAATAEMIVTNNLFVNTGFVPEYPGFHTLIEDHDLLPRGLINMDTIMDLWINTWYLGIDSLSFYPVAENERKVLFHNNSVYWDPRLNVIIADSLKEIPDSIGDYKWRSQMILMNSRTKAMFDDDKSYPYLNEGTTLNIEPKFLNNKDLIDEWISFVASNCTPGAPGEGNLFPKWRTNTKTNIVNPDWPVLANLAYTNADLLRAGINEYPLGDLNWFSYAKDVRPSWEATRESDKLWEALKSGNLPKDWDTFQGVISGVKQLKMPVSQLSVYPNPFSKTTNVEFELNDGANAKLIVYNVVGEKIKSVSLGYMAIGKHNVLLEVDDLASGMYILKLDTDNMNGVSTKITVY